MRSRSTAAWLATAALVAAGVAGCGSSSGAGAKGSAGSGSSAGGGPSGGNASRGASASNSAASSGASGAGPYSHGTSATSSTSSRTAVASASSNGGAGTAVTSKSVSGLGKVLAAGPKRLTLYVFLADTARKSNCNGSCAAVWPPLEAKGALQGVDGVSSSALGTITRSNGGKQVTYHGHPLYYYAADHSANDALGEGVDSFGARWYVLASTGREVTKG